MNMKCYSSKWLLTLWLCVFVKDSVSTEGNSECMPLSHCKQFLELLQAGTSQGIRTVIQSLCGWEGFRIKVRCPKTTGSFEPFPEHCGIRPAEASERIYGGSIAPMGGFPWVAAFWYTDLNTKEKNMLCAGSVINARYVVTAAHCISPKDYELSYIRLGEWNMATIEDCIQQNSPNRILCAPRTTDYGIEKVVVHPDFERRSDLLDDIAVIRLNKTIDFADTRGYVAPICFPPRGKNAQYHSKGKQPTVVGWGRTEKTQSSDTLLQVTLPFASNKRCRQRFPTTFIRDQLCVGGETGKDSCKGDSGGPLMLKTEGSKHELIGIVSFGPDVCGKDIPAVYTSASSYTDWVRNVMKPW